MVRAVMFACFKQRDMAMRQKYSAQSFNRMCLGCPGYLLWRLVVCLIVCTPMLQHLQAAQDSLVCSFENGADGFAGQGSLAIGQGVNGSTCLRVENVSNDWESITRLMPDAMQDIKRLCLEIRPSNLEQITIRFTDATGQIFQNIYTLKENQWQRIEIDNLTAGQSWGGAGDKVWHGPCERLDILNEQQGGIALIDNVTFEFQEGIALLAAKRTAMLDAAKYVQIASFDADLDDFDGAQLQRLTDDPASGQGHARFSNRNEDFVEILRRVNLQRDVVQIRFKVRSQTAHEVGLRLADATGQEFLQRYPLSIDHTWQEITVRRFDQCQQSWGGANDKKWHSPCKVIAFILERRQAEIDIDSIDLWLADGQPLTDFTWQLSQLGNVYFTGTPVTILFETRGDRVDFRVTDFWQNPVMTCSIKPENGRGTLTPPAENGYFLVHARVYQHDKPIADHYTAYGVIPMHTVSNPAASTWGVATHFAQGMTPKMLPLLKAAGIGMIRDELYWDQVEQEKGKYTFTSRYENYMQALEQVQMSPLIIMTFANKLHDEGKTPWTDAGCDAFGDYGNAIQDRFGKQINWLEVWNEYNGSWCDGPAAQDRPKSYVKLLKHAYEKIKSRNPDTKVLGCAAVLLPRPYMEGIFANGGLPYMDGVVIHPYRNRPEGVDDEVEQLRAAMRQYDQGREKEIWATETGLASLQEYDWEKGLNMYEKARFEAARYLPRQYALLLKAGVKRIFWYVCADTDLFKTMGLLRQEADVAGMGPLTVTPNYVAYATLIRQLDGKPFQNREGYQTYSRAYCLRFGSTTKQTDQDVHVLWGAEPAIFELTALGSLTCTDIMGRATTLNPVKGKVHLPVGLDALYVTGPMTQVNEISNAGTCIAATYEDYSEIQGKNNWFYGYRKTLTGSFESMQWKKTLWDYRWSAPGYDYLHLSQDGGEPAGNGSEPVYQDRRWISTLSGALTITGEVGSWDDKSDGLVFHVLVDGEKVFSQTIAGGQIVPCNIPIKVNIGSTVDMLVGPNQESSYDATMMNLRLMQQ